MFSILWGIRGMILVNETACQEAAPSVKGDPRRRGPACRCPPTEVPGPLTGPSPRIGLPASTAVGDRKPP